MESEAAKLDRVRRAARKAEDGVQERDAAIRDATAVGVTRQAVADAAGLTRARVQQIVGTGAGAEARDERTLHAAMELVLRERGGGWVAVSEVAREIAARGLYVRGKDGAAAPPTQVRARASKYPGIFEGTADGSGRIRLR